MQSDASKRIVVTGASGALGTRASHELASAGHQVVGICLNPENRPDVHTVDLRAAMDEWIDFFHGADVVIHFAGNPIPRIGWRDAEVNIAITRNVIEASRRKGVRRVIFASSNWVMAGHRFSGGPIAEDMPVSPLNPYGVSKFVGEELGRAYAAAGFLEFLALRIGYLPADGRSGPQLFYGAWGQQMWLAPDDFCAAMRRAVEADLGERFAVINLLSDNPGSRWSLATAREKLDYASKHGVAPVIGMAHRFKSCIAHATFAVGRRLDTLWIRRRW